MPPLVNGADGRDGQLFFFLAAFFLAIFFFATFFFAVFFFAAFFFAVGGFAAFLRADSSARASLSLRSLDVNPKNPL